MQGVTVLSKDKVSLQYTSTKANSDNKFLGRVVDMKSPKEVEEAYRYFYERTFGVAPTNHDVKLFMNVVHPKHNYVKLWTEQMEFDIAEQASQLVDNMPDEVVHAIATEAATIQ